jgi:hypothetical protein
VKTTTAASVTRALRKTDLARFVGKGMAIQVIGCSDGYVGVYSSSPTLVKDALETAGFVARCEAGHVFVSGRAVSQPDNGRIGRAL